MPLPLYMDVHVPAAITAGLRRRGIDVLTSQEDGSDRFPDDRLLERAAQLDRVLFSQDDDLLALAAEWQQKERVFSGLLYAHQLRTGIGGLINDIELVLTCCSATDLSSSVIYLPLN